MNLLIAKILGAVALLAALAFGVNSFLDYEQGIGDARATARFEKALDKQKGEAAATLAQETAKASAAEKKLNDFKNQQEVKDAAAAKANLDQANRLRDLAGPIGRLRDPYAPTGCGGCREDSEGESAAAANAGAKHPPQAGGLLSGQLTALLLELTASADAINAAYASCRADAYSVREAQ